MSKIVDFGKAKEDREPKVQGTAVCVACDHKWQETISAYDLPENLTCPKCKTDRALFQQAFVPAEEYIFVHSCGNSAFHATPQGLFCLRCGDTLEYAFFI